MRVSEVVGVGGSQVIGVGVVMYVVVEEGGGYTGALRHPRPHVSVG